jgi:prepilin-type N-terminal cleavage/methylation domain-containing protein
MLVHISFRLGGANGRTSHRRVTSGAFSLIELLVVMAIALILGAIAVTSISSVSTSGNLTAAADTISGTIEQARSYAMANNTYTWLGFFEENGAAASANPAQSGVGRIVMAIAASSDGSMIYSANSGAAVTIDPTRLLEVGKLIRVTGAHLEAFPDGSGGGQTFDTRPALQSDNARVGLDPLPGGASPSFQFPVGQAASAQYTFTNVLQFSPQGEVLFSGMAGQLTSTIEIGLEPAHGNIPNSASKNDIALQVAGITGTVIEYRR